MCHGDIFCGWSLLQMDLAGSAVAFRRAMVENFQRPVFVGDEVSLYATILKVGRTSVTVKVEAFARRGRSGKKIQVTEGCLHRGHGGGPLCATSGYPKHTRVNLG